ncbi:MAG: hypothetical protein M3O01_02645, partial [Pseudomonadota bacterium]|nr:hypothetical protein [Pseudomonadota bacterium]
VFGSAGARPRTPAARAARSAELLDLTARAVTAAMARAGTTRADVDRYVPASFLPPFRTALARRLGFEADPQAPAGARAHLASAEPLAALASALTSLSPGAQRTVLLCDNAVCGMAGALIARLHRPAAGCVAPALPLHA